MVTNRRVKTTDRASAGKFAQVGNAFLASAQALSDVAGDGDHLQAVQVLRGALGTKLPDAQEKRLRRIISANDEISYQGTYYPLREGRALLDRAQLFVTWGRTLYESRRVRVK